ncbi:hypothetical protein CGLO_13799 [Colletotrichum gloeosporioides Cg-14]|uniref:Heterokaryon incompatibility domain-containing protein n=1 Tax=Colletotrichum gloeosporioides (strain Cg-14) TaxID=1237896 RepID=T0LFP4_COLGC|nr:hypothetical protein CGLO_13799 [Colletotrichum gloeosporioides Cg-14]
MRDATRVLRIWADALCINQGDVPERNAQVKLMGKIYGVASNTIIYLGHLTEDAAEVLAATTWRATEFDYEMHDDNTGATHVAEVSNKHTLVEAACRGILSRPWFQRVWVLQELILSKSPWIQCGHQRVRWEDLCRFLLCKATNPPNKHGALLSVLGNMNETRNLRAGGVGKPLWDVLKIRRGFGAADPRDRVYANFGIINDLRRVRRYLDVDYGVSLQVVLSKLAEYIISTKGATYLMTQVQDLRFEDYVEGLPSWVPQWQYSFSEMPDFGGLELNFSGTYSVLNIDGMPSILAHIGCDFDMVASKNISTAERCF